MAERDESPDAPTTADERAEAEALRQALADPSLTSAPADFLRSVALSHEPLELPAPAHTAIAARSIVRGDASRPVISAASILAKTVRDAYMLRADTLYPCYRFAAHKGYGTEAHLRLLREFGPCPMHRRSFAPVAVAP